VGVYPLDLEQMFHYTFYMSIWKVLKRLWKGSRRKKKYIHSFDTPIDFKLIYSNAYEKRKSKRKSSSVKEDKIWQFWNSLSRREKDVTALTCLGYTNPQIAARLNLSVETVRTYLGFAIHKLNLQKKADLRVFFAGWDFSEWERRKDPYR